jgi:hypothetical protein
MADFRKLGRLRRLRTLNFTTIMCLLYLRMCIWVMMDGGELEAHLEPSLAIERLRSVNEALAGPSSSQVKRLREALERVIGTPLMTTLATQEQSPSHWRQLTAMWPGFSERRFAFGRRSPDPRVVELQA